MCKEMGVCGCGYVGYVHWLHRMLAMCGEYSTFVQKIVLYIHHLVSSPRKKATAATGKHQVKTQEAHTHSNGRKAASLARYRCGQHFFRQVKSNFAETFYE